jgi:metal-sulfur cluster biosynthetic enzyme
MEEKNESMSVARMDPSVQRRIKKVLKNLKEPQSLMSFYDIGFVQRISYSATDGKMLLDCGEPERRDHCYCNSFITTYTRQGLERQLLEAFKAEFPDIQVETV